ncbi:hypothetical protein ASE04_23000 [Rhizobium sp. Root708]|uniref:hypothetical protein n=1 Tax=Rhizobium sp. Root708 TaxID=1736592 RepID=UPI0006F52B62|nr:hypothetical protein [Rhizobium sp. Root708]KRB61232.1 hypothetical protein ASE04_23000 [Rhizobium sp. Root708]
MRRLFVISSVITLALAGSAMAQASMGMDSSGRFDGSPPIGTSFGTDQSDSGLSIPLDSFETNSTSYSAPVYVPRCGQYQRNSANRNASQACATNR